MALSVAITPTTKPDVLVVVTDAPVSTFAAPDPLLTCPARSNPAVVNPETSNTQPTLSNVPANPEKVTVTDVTPEAALRQYQMSVFVGPATLTDAAAFVACA